MRTKMVNKIWIFCTEMEMSMMLDTRVYSLILIAKGHYMVRARLRAVVKVILR